MNPYHEYEEDDEIECGTPPIVFTLTDEDFIDDINTQYSVKPYPNNPTEISPQVLDKLDNEITVFETSATRRRYSSLAHLRFFGCDTVAKYIHLKDPISANVFKYGIHQLCQKNILNLFSFETEASLTSVPTALGVTTALVYSGNFVLEEVSPDHPDKIIMEVSPYSSGECGIAFTGLSYEIISKFIALISKTAAEYHLYRNKVFTNQGVFMELPKDITLDDVVLPPNVRSVLDENIIGFIRNKMKRMVKYNLPTKRGIIIEGPPGVGKSHACRALAATAGVSVMIISDVSDKYQIRRIFEIAKEISPIILIFEDIDIYLFDRDSGDSKLSTLLNLMDGIEINSQIITILTTNKLEVLDTAVKDRPGRFDRVVKVDFPDQTIALSMLKKFSEGFNTEGVDFERIVKELSSKKFSGAHYKEIIITACIDAPDDTDEVVFTTESLLAAADKLCKNSSKAREKHTGFHK